MIDSSSLSSGFMVGNVRVEGDLILAPMDGISDVPFRALTRRLGSAMSYTEFINAIDVMSRHPHLDERLSYAEDERPVVYQVFDDNPERLISAALRLRKRNPDIIDINMGCSAKGVSNRGAGAALLKTPGKIATIFSRLSRELDIPVTGKIRLGWDTSSRNYLEIARIIEDNGGKLLAVHGRTKEQSYGGTADWDAIAEIKQSLSIPVIGNGDVRTVADIERMKQHTGCDGVMIGRAAIDNPWIFSRLDREQVPPDVVYQTIISQLDNMMEFYGPQRGLTIFRKFAYHYLKPIPKSTEQRVALLTAEDKDNFLQYLNDILSRTPAAAV